MLMPDLFQNKNLLHNLMFLVLIFHKRLFDDLNCNWKVCQFMYSQKDLSKGTFPNDLVDFIVLKGSCRVRFVYIVIIRNFFRHTRRLFSCVGGSSSGIFP
jgi:hypothetical protein